MRAKAFSLVEVLIVMVIIGILGGVALAALWFSVGSYSQMEDYTSAESEMSHAVHRLSREFVLIGLGMPNNRKGLGSFALTFRDAAGTNWPIMALMGNAGTGGPVTVANPVNPAHTYTQATMQAALAALTDEKSLPLGTPAGVLGSGGDAYIGPELYYAWGIPTGVKAWFEVGADRTADNDHRLRITELISPTSDNVVEYLQNFVFDIHNAGLLAAPQTQNTRSWLLFPTLRLPMLLEEWAPADAPAGLAVRVAPVDESVLPVKGTLMGFDEIHLIQAARLHRNANNELVRVVFHGDYNTPNGIRTDVLARNIVGLQFVYNPVSRLLTMYIAARGHERNAVGAGRNSGWPAWLPEQIAVSDSRFRTVVKALTWRIRN